MPLINCKVYLELNLIEDCILCIAGESGKFAITVSKLLVPIGTLSTNYSVLIDGGNFYDQPINDMIKQYAKVRKVSKVYGDDYTNGCLLNYAYFKDNYRLTAVDLIKQKALDIDPRVIQQILFQGVVGWDNNTEIRVYTILGKSTETMLEIFKGTAKVL